MDFQSLELPIPNIVEKYEENMQAQIFKYLTSLSTEQKIAYKIAYDHLGTSFNILKSNGYLSWKKNNDL
jgi:competence protein ComGC